MERLNFSHVDDRLQYLQEEIKFYDGFEKQFTG